MALPNNQIDGFVVFDSSGSRYQYVLGMHGWINIGAGISTQIVDYTKSGLITPSMVGMLEDARAGEAGSFKIYQNQDAYYYLLLPQGRMFKFSSENNDVRVELDRSVLTNLLQYAACPGAVGARGLDGDNGEDGAPGPIEKLLRVVVDGATLSFNASVDVVIDTAISIRLLYDRVQKIEIWYDIGSKQHQIVSNNSGYTLEGVSINYDGTLSVSIRSSDSWGIGWTAKARQRGPDGRGGIDGNPFIVVSSIVAELTSRGALISLRNVGDNLRTMNRGIDPENLPIAHLRPYQSSGLCNEMTFATTSDKYAAVAPSLDYSKPIWRWALDAPGHDFGALNTPVWTPDPSCGSGAVFNWWDGLNERPNIVEAAHIPEKCCQEDFFFCPSLGSCGIGSNAINLSGPSNSSSSLSGGGSE